MKKRTSAFARIFAVLALAAAIAAVFVIVSGGLDDKSDKTSRNGSQQQGQNHEKKPRTKAATYEVKPGDTLTRISHQTGVPVEELVDLNPEVDPQILIAGETLKLR
ncbi:MAG: LysM peptidoglycan-binding domain-containing protein [Thermoleophilia bacterium]|nr:LysM peptidoglycan-binding domain-containing protein [Thermoleophilia bacterium]